MASDRSAGLRTRWLDRPHPRRFDPSRPDYEACLEAHDNAVATGDQGYLDPSSGLFVMTAKALASRPCCNRGCRHCPYYDEAG